MPLELAMKHPHIETLSKLDLMESELVVEWRGHRPLAEAPPELFEMFAEFLEDLAAELRERAGASE